mgnify:CR=1 FL=1
MKHSYQLGCPCARCTRECVRRTKQAANDPQRFNQRKRLYARPRPMPTRQPVIGTQEWAETRGDDLGDSPDY